MSSLIVTMGSSLGGIGSQKGSPQKACRDYILAKHRLWSADGVRERIIPRQEVWGYFLSCLQSLAL